MKEAEQGYLLLTSHMGDSTRPVLTVAQLRNLALAVQSAERSREDRDLQPEDLMALGYGREFADRVVALLSEKSRLKNYVFKGWQEKAVPICRISSLYPARLRQKLGLDSPGVLWAKGDFSLLEKPAIALVGSRELREENAAFAAEVGKQAALQGFVLISGNARGADRIAQESCLKNGGQVISIVADSLQDKTLQDNVLYLSEDSYDLPFSAQRAHSRNRLIHAMGQMTFVAQSNLEKGGSWSGAVENLRHGRSALYVFCDGSAAAQALIDRGAKAVDLKMLSDLKNLPGEEQNKINL